MGWQDAPVVGGGWKDAPIVGQEDKKPEDPRPPLMKFMQEAAGGLVRGAGSIGSTLLASPADLGVALGIRKPEKTLSTLIAGDQPTEYQQRNKSMDDAFTMSGVDTKSLPFQGGKMTAEVLGTAGAGGAMANGVRAVAPSVARAAPAFLDALQTGGMTANGAKGLAGELSTRAAGGALNGAASAGLVNPEEMGVGAALGGAVPLATKTFGAVGNLIGKGAKAATTGALGLATGAGSEPVAQAFRAGKAGSRDFLDNMTGAVPQTEVLDRAKTALQAMQAQKSAEYRSGMVPIKNDKTVLAFDGIDKAVSDAAAMTSFKGQSVNEQAAGAVERMRAAVEQWKKLDPAEFHTPEGLDALKQKLGGELESIPFNEKTARLAASKIYNATKEEIQQQAPEYAKVMKNYQAASEQITEIERALSLNPSASVDTAMRKLQSLMRNNVQTNYGARLSNAKDLEAAGGVDLMSSLAGQAMNSWAPRSLAGQLGGVGVGLSALGGNMLPLAALPFQSPRLVGSAAYGAGKVAGLLSNGVKGPAGLLGGPSFEQLGYRLPGVLAADR